MPILPIIDLLILLGWSTLSLGAVLKVIYLTTSYRPTMGGLGPLDCLLIAAVFLIFALTLAARTWVKMNEPQLSAARRAASTLEAYRETRARSGARPFEAETLPPADRAAGSQS